MITYWVCLTGNPPHLPPCDAGGVYEQSNSGGDAEKHTKATGHGTMTSLRPIRGASAPPPR